jgi:malate synthase
VSLPPDLQLQLRGPDVPDTQDILTTSALAFVAALSKRFRPRIRARLAARLGRQARCDAGALPGFRPETKSVRDGTWSIAPVPDCLRDRRVEITGPVDRKMVINALNSGACVFMADFEDSSAPTWANMMSGQKNLYDAVRRTIDFTHPRTGKRYALADETAVLMVRPRGLHLPEAHILHRGEPVAASLVDFGLFFFHNALPLVEAGRGPFFYLPKLECAEEAKLWNDIFVFAQQTLGLPLGTIKATVLIETLPAAFEMDEILHALREHSAGLNCGRWDYIFSLIKTTRAHRQFLLPDRGAIGMHQPCMAAYATLAVQTCHRRGAHAMGGMAAQIPIRDDPEASAAALGKVRADKLREVLAGHDGTWVAHPGLIATARAAFDAHMPGTDQIHRLRDDVVIDEAMLLAVPQGERTEAGLRQNLNVGVLYIEAWLGGQGCVPLYNLMEDAATAEISRTQVWQWLHHEAALSDGRVVTEGLVETMLTEELNAMRVMLGEARYTAGDFDAAAHLFMRLVTAEVCPDFLTLAAYPRICTLTEESSC